MTQGEIRITSIGHIAHQVFLRKASAFVSGTSSQGIYLQPMGDLILYLTPELFRGPLTINMRGKSDSIFIYKPGNIVRFGDNEIVFKDPNLTINIKSPLIWKPNQPPSFQRQSTEQFNKLISKAQEIFPDHPYRNVLEIVEKGKRVPIEGFPGIATRILSLSRALAEDNPFHIFSEMKLTLGSGPGLTPLGDDLVLGILLAIGRTRRQLTWGSDLIRYYHTLISSADEKTTTVSWSILSCAVLGSADERIIRVLDGLIAGREIPDHDLKSLLEWGSSSGIAVLAGMIMVLSSFPGK